MNDIDILTEYYTGKTKAFFLAHPDYKVPKKNINQLAEAIDRYNEGEPVAYIIGECSFCGDKYIVSPSCLIPRNDTELLADKLVTLLPKGGSFADLCTGSGCVAISSLKRLPDSSALAVDISKEALSLAAVNAKVNGVERRIVFMRADIFSPSFLIGYTFDIIVANPPYIESSAIDSLDESVQREPRIALDGGHDGLIFYKFIIPNYMQFLNKNGFMLLEIGYNQGEKIKNICIENGVACTIFRDYAGHDRIALVKKL